MKSRAFDTFGAIVNARGIESLARSISSSGDFGLLNNLIGKRFPNLSDFDSAKLARAVTSSIESATALSSGTELLPSPVSELSGSITGGDRFRTYVEVTWEDDLTGDYHKINVYVNTANFPYTDSLLEAAMEVAGDIVGNYPGDFGGSIFNPDSATVSQIYSITRVY